MIKAQSLTKRFGKKVAVNDVSFEVEEGKVTGFLGPNGAGKSSTMRLMLELDRGEGSTEIDGKKLHEHDQPSKVVGILLEAKAFHPTRTARNHLRVLATEGNIPLSRVDEVLETVGLASEAKKKPGKFSLGMSQRLGIAAALLAEPKYLILDEPANGLDPEGIVWLREFLKAYAKQGNTVFVSSHLLSEMSQMAENIIVIGKGRLLANTSVSKLLSSSTHTSVFVRSSNQAALEKLLLKNKIFFEKQGKGLKLSGVKTDKVGKLAFDAKLPILELTSQNASLEEAFLELTADSEEFRAMHKEIS